MGIWQATTNKVTNSSLETDLTGWDDQGTGVTRTRSSEQAKFGGFSQKVVTDGGSDFQGAIFKGMTWTSGQVLTGSVWVHGTAGQLCRLVLFNPATFSAIENNPVGVALPATGWNRMTVTGTAADTPADGWFIVDTGSPAQAVTWYLDGAQVEVSRIATPFTLASRSNSRAQVSASVLDELQGWVALRIRPGWSTAGEPGGGSGFPVLFQWSDDGSNQILCFYVEANNQIQMSREAGNVGSSAATAVAVSVNTPFTLIGTWTPTQVAISINGAAFTQVSNTNIPTLAATLFDVGSTTGIGNFFNGDMLWVATGKGTLSNANAAAIHATGNTDPTPSLFPSVTRLSGIWTADTSAMIIYR